MSGRDAEPNGRQVFRPRRVLAAAMAAAGLLWVAVLVYLLRFFDEVPLKTFLSAGFFVLFFAVSLMYYGRTHIVVDARGLTYQGMVRTRRFTFADIRKLDVLPGPVTVYAIRGKAGLVHFTSFFRHHQQLARLLVERAGLGPVPG
ncbi:PH domain-containing protein [Myxococcus sp. AM001]|uniref:PH domain-containing protein n=1 Tax=Myxococcus TaxID=32 RepID=UPI0013D4AC13|nr:MULTISPECIES: PH domain-containing protein [Myxococcus]NVJ06877.1 PH domain-containing protein [Myxococcus sp. AM001]WIG96290.1 PH domain-containing protein [Myxococcus sp. SDU36]